MSLSDLSKNQCLNLTHGWIGLAIREDRLISILVQASKEREGGRYVDRDGWMTPNEARALAYQLLSLAEEAEKDSKYPRR